MGLSTDVNLLAQIFPPVIHSPPLQKSSVHRNNFFPRKEENDFTKLTFAIFVAISPLSLSHTLLCALLPFPPSLSRWVFFRILYLSLLNFNPI